MKSPRNIVIAGGGLGAVRTAQGLRDLGYDGRIRLFSEEMELPYDRPPLSKAYLLGVADDDQISLLGPEQYSELGIEVFVGHRAARLETLARRVILEDGEQVDYDRLVIATGGRPKRLGLFDGLEGVHFLRTVGDARLIRDALAKRPRLGIIGGGFIGLEIAATARTLGCEVTVVEACDVPLATIIGSDLGGWVRQWHEGHGVSFRCGVVVAGVHGAGRVEVLELDDGSRLPVDLVVVGVGMAPNVEWLHDASLELHRGVACDVDGKTAAPDVFGVGDAACRHIAGQCRPGGHWTSTTEQATRVAMAVLGEAPAGLPRNDDYFWSDQYDARLQCIGTGAGNTRVTLESGHLEDASFVAFCRSGTSVTGVFAVNSPREFVRSRMALSS